MNLIRISENTLVNPECISLVEFQVVQGKKQLVVTIDGKQKIADIAPMELLQEFTKAGVGVDSKVWQYWAG